MKIMRMYFARIIFVSKKTHSTVASVSTRRIRSNIRYTVEQFAFPNLCFIFAGNKKVFV